MCRTLMALADAALLEYNERITPPSIFEQDMISAPNIKHSDESTRNDVSPSSSERNTSIVACSIPVDQTLEFVETLRKTLDDEGQYSQIITWMPDGKAFKIVSPKQFSKEAMPNIFNIRNMSSFVRKLTRFGFTRRFDRGTRNADIFAHDEFVRSDPERASRIKYAPPAKLIAARLGGRMPTHVRGSAPFPAFPTREPGSSPPVCPRSHQAPANPKSDDVSPCSKDGVVRSSLNGGSMAPQSQPRDVFSSSSLASIMSLENVLGSAIEELHRERELLRQRADAETMALVRLLEEENRIRCRVSSVIRPDGRTATFRSANLMNHSYYASALHAQQHLLQQQQQQQQHQEKQHGFPFLHRSMY
jgi:hypothetical protein